MVDTGKQRGGQTDRPTNRPTDIQTDNRGGGGGCFRSGTRQLLQATISFHVFRVTSTFFGQHLVMPWYLAGKRTGGMLHVVFHELGSVAFLRSACSSHAKRVIVCTRLPG